jgi:pyruvate formate-lyase/glycerol dehydratase family glycyl radical enzyme
VPLDLRLRREVRAMNERTARLRQESIEAVPRISPERANLLTDFYQTNEGKYSVPVMRARSFYYLCEHKTIYLGKDELIVAERGPRPKAVPTYPELTCHSLEDLRILNSRPKTNYVADEECFKIYTEKIIPYWRDRSLRTRLFQKLPTEWHQAYQAGMFTEFMEQRAPGHTVLDDKIYHKGMLDFKKEIAETMTGLDFLHDTDAYAKQEQLKAMSIACDAAILFAQRHAQLACQLVAQESDHQRRSELEKIAEVCEHVPAYAPRDFHEALQYYWFCHLGVITELNGWDSFNPGHLDQHLYPFYTKGLQEGTLTKDAARELLECFFIKFNNHPAPPKVGVTAAESGTYTDFANINLGGLLPDGSDAVNELSYMLLDIVDDMHILQPSTNIQLSRKSPDAFLKYALRVVRKGYGFPSIFNADSVVAEQIRQGKTLEDARAGGCSGCVEVGAFGKEAYILTGYFNLVKVLELALHNGVNPVTGKLLGLPTGGIDTFQSLEQLFQAFRRQLHHFLEIKIRGNQLVERMYAELMPAPFLSVLIDDCIHKGKDYNNGGPRYNNTYIQFVGLGSLTDSFSAIKEMVFDAQQMSLCELVKAMDVNFEGYEPLRQRLVNRTHKYGNDDDYTDQIMLQIFNAYFEEVDGRPNTKGGHYRVEMLSTTCHIYFGSVTGAMTDGRKAGQPLSEGISPVQGADRGGPTAVIKSAGKMDHIKTGGALLNMKFTPSLLATEEGLDKWAHLVRSYFKMDGHHVQFNVVTAETLRRAQANPENYRDLIVRVAGYSDYFCDVSPELQNEIISRTEHAGF